MVYTRYEPLKWLSSLAELRPGVKGSLNGRGAEWSRGRRGKSGAEFEIQPTDESKPNPAEDIPKGDGHLISQCWTCCWFCSKTPSGLFIHFNREVAMPGLDQD